ncbi:hypothetical protein [Eubacterium sp. LMAG:50]|uniref:hypothetical protein n=1 Tax=Eubacterium sp. LMAG:50 TaxID=1969563 RepID=UPI0025BE6802|nr:hypothetical protein [Eubacterium sp. LMAG:50]
MISKIAWKKVMAVICSTALVGTVMCGFGHKVTYAEGTTSEVNGDQGTLPWEAEFYAGETENNGDEGTFPWNDEFTTTAPETTTIDATTKGNGDNWGEDIFTTSHQETTTKAPETTTKAPETTTKAQETTTVPETTTTKAPETTKASETTTQNVTTNNNSNAQPTSVGGTSAISTSTATETTIGGATVYTVNNQTAPVIKKAIKKKSAKKATVKLKRVAGVNGYQIKVSLNKKFKKKTTVTINTKKAKAVVKKLKAGKKYFVKARTYVIVDGKKVYGKWSKVKKVKNK